MTENDLYDVVIVGYGPTGQTLAALLTQKHYRVAVVERWPEIFPLPRAGHVDHEVMRILQSVGVAQDIEDNSWKLTHYEFLNAQSEVLHRFDWGFDAKSGWYSDYSLFQPQLEALLHAQVEGNGGAEVFRGWQAEAVDEGADDVVVTVRRAAQVADGSWVGGDESRELRGRVVVGCDGANSLVRTARGIGMDDFGFEADWLVIFAEPENRELTGHMPDMAQILDPRRPTTAFRSSGNRFCRWEFMLMPGETPEEMSTDDAAWRLIEPWGINPGNARLVRNSVFRFRSLVADRWRSGRSFVAGDAAHLMPPFMGQGMCSGMRDAKTLAWKLDLVLSGRADDALLDTYATERRGHVAEIVEASLRTGRMISITDPAEAQKRDDLLRSGAVAPPSPLPGLVDGVLLRDAAGTVAEHAGLLSMQAWVDVDGARRRIDDVLGHGWTVLVTGWDPHDALPADVQDVLTALEARVQRLEATDVLPDGALRDADGTFVPWVGELTGGAGGIIVRPDFYLFGTVTTPDALHDAVRQLGRQLHLTTTLKATV